MEVAMIISEARNKYSEYGKKLNKLEAELSKKRDTAKENAKLTNDKSYFDEAATLELSISDVDGKIKDNKKAMEELNKQWQLEYDAQLQKNSKKKSRYKGNVIKSVSCCIDSFVIMHNFILRNAWVDINYIIRIFNISCVGLH